MASSQALFEMNVSCYHNVVDDGGIHVNTHYEKVSYQIRMRQPIFEAKMSELLANCVKKESAEKYVGEEIAQGPDVSYEETFAEQLSRHTRVASAVKLLILS